ncbi:MAG: TrkA family potassium uptake protein [Tannerellaceae bacterium]|nr:TrkA family potassium uptake protein [Tannerellaceae bacterium]
MKYLVLGLGYLGRAIAENLVRIGHEVIGVDKDMHQVDLVKQRISATVCLDTTDREALHTLPLNEMDAIFITYGKDFGNSIQTIALLRNLNMEKLIVRSISPIHETVVRAIGVKEIMTPEEDYAAIYASQSMLGDLFKHWYRITDTHHIYEMVAPHTFVGQKISHIRFEENFDVRLAGIERPQTSRNLLGLKQTAYKVVDRLDADLVIEEGDILILFGRMEVIKKLGSL